MGRADQTTKVRGMFVHGRQLSVDHGVHDAHRQLSRTLERCHISITIRIDHDYIGSVALTKITAVREIVEVRCQAGKTPNNKFRRQ